MTASVTAAPLLEELELLELLELDEDESAPLEELDELLELDEDESAPLEELDELLELDEDESAPPDELEELLELDEDEPELLLLSGLPLLLLEVPELPDELLELDEEEELPPPPPESPPLLLQAINEVIRKPPSNMRADSTRRLILDAADFIYADSFPNQAYSVTNFLSTFRQRHAIAHAASGNIRGIISRAP